jgi:hypothetical protein
MKTALGILLVSTGLLAAGCGKSGDTSSVSGLVSYKGNPVTGGTMAFHAGDKVFPASLGPDGKYSCLSVPPGNYTVTIDTKRLQQNVGVDPDSTMKEMFKKKGQGGSEAPGGFDEVIKKLKEEQGKGKLPDMLKKLKYVRIPEKYADVKTSDLSVKVGSGSNTQDLTLRD